MLLLSHFCFTSCQEILNTDMKVLFVFSVVVVAAIEAASVLYPYHPAAYLGSSAQYHSQDVLGNYAFGYNEGHPGAATYRREVGDVSGKKVGSYGVAGSDGKVRVVDYVADAAGFRANIKTTQKEVKTEQAPADVTISQAEVQQVVQHPVVQHPVVKAPVYFGAPYYYGYPAEAYRFVY